MAAKRPIRMKPPTKSTRRNKSARVRISDRPIRGVGVWAIGAGVMCVLGGAMVFGARQGTQPASRASREAPLPTAPQVVASKTPAPRALPVNTSPANATVPSAAVLESGADAPAPTAPAVTITGCLERADETFRLKDVSGTDAVKARSWKSGFLKKRAASVGVVDASKRLRLPEHVGERVSLTGSLMNREMHVRTLQRVSKSCAVSQKVKL